MAKASQGISTRLGSVSKCMQVVSLPRFCLYRDIVISERSIRQSPSDVEAILV